MDGIKLVEIDPERVNGAMTVFGIRMRNYQERLCVTFRSGTLTEYYKWTKSIQRMILEHE